MSITLEVPDFLQKSRPEPLPVQLRNQRRARRSAMRKMAVRIGIGGVVLWCLGGIGHPYLEAHHMSRDAQRVSVQIQAELKKRHALESRIAELQTPQGKQDAARVYGWVLQGECPIVCAPPDPAESSRIETSIAQPPPARQASVLKNLQADLGL